MLFKINASKRTCKFQEANICKRTFGKGVTLICHQQVAKTRILESQKHTRYETTKTPFSSVGYEWRVGDHPVAATRVQDAPALAICSDGYGLRSVAVTAQTSVEVNE